MTVVAATLALAMANQAYEQVFLDHRPECARLDSAGQEVANNEAIKVAEMLGLRNDAAETLALSRELEYQKARTFETQYAAFKARSLCPISTEAGPDMEYVTYTVFDTVIAAKMISRLTTSLPKVGLTMRQYKMPFRDVATSYAYNMKDMRQALKIGRDYLGKFVQLAKLSIEKAFDEVIALGNPATGMTGMANHPNVPVFAVPTGVWTTSTTAQQMIEDLLAIDKRIPLVTNDLFKGTTLLLAPSVFTLAANKLIGQELSSTVLKRFLEVSINIKEVDTWLLLEQAGPGGKPRSICYSRDPMILEAELGAEFVTGATETKMFEVETYCYGQIAGVAVHQPYGMIYVDNIAA